MLYISYKNFFYKDRVTSIFDSGLKSKKIYEINVYKTINKNTKYIFRFRMLPISTVHLNKYKSISKANIYGIRS